MSDVELGTLYETNQELYKQIEAPSEQEIDKQLAQVGAWFSSQFYKNYYLLYCREKHDFTIFHLENSEYFEAVQELKQVLQSRGTILEIVYSHDFHFYECWVRDEETEEVNMYAFFSCDDWVIDIE